MKSSKKKPTAPKAAPAANTKKREYDLLREARLAATSHAEAPAPAWRGKFGIDGIVRALLLAFAATLPLYYDLSVPEVSGDIRWAATEFFAGLCALLLMGQALVRGQGRLNLRWPVLMWVALGLAVWAAVSLVDALNASRGIILIKAMYAQLILLAVVYHVAKPGFGRKLMWAMVLPLFVTSIVGMWQFQNMTDAGLQLAMTGSWFWWLFKPVVWLADWLAQVPVAIMGWEARQYGVVGFATNFFMQSAVPGSTFANKNLAGSWTAMMLPVAFYLLITAKRWPAQAVASVLLGLGSVFLVYSRARASWVALFAALMTLVALVIIVPAWRKAVWRHLDMSHLWWMLLPVAMLAYWGGDKSPIVGTYAIDRSPTEQVAALAGSSWNEIGGRLAYNLNSTVITKDYWFNGVGLGNFFTIYPPYFDAVVVTPWNSYNVMARPQRTHTDMMQAFDEMGLPGGILYVSLFVLGIAMAMRLAGRRAGALGGYLVGAGLATMVFVLTVFLEYQNMLAIPSPWNVVVQLGMLGFIGVMVFGAARNALRVQDEQQAADDMQLMGLMAGIAVLCISINALFDFPMQLPTAPAAAALLMGVICNEYMRRNPKEVAGPRVTLKTGRAGTAALFVVLGAAWLLALWDCHTFRQGQMLLKQGMVRLFSGINDETTVALLEKAYETYPYDQRIQEHLGVAYANYSGTVPIDLDTRIGKLVWVLKGDPWGSNHMINLAGLYLQKAELAQQAGDMAAAQDYLARADVLFRRLQRTADFSHFTWGVGGTLRMMEGRNEDAMWMFRRALAIEPTYPPAVVGLQTAISRSGIRPLTVKDGISGR